MRNDDASYFRSGECTVDFAGQSDPPRRIHVVGRHVRNVIDLDLGIYGKVRDSGHQILAGDGWYRRLLYGINLHCDCPTRGDQRTYREVVLSDRRDG